MVPGSAGGSPAPGKGLAPPNPYLITKSPLSQQSPDGRGSGGKPHLLSEPLRLCAFARDPARTLPTESWMGEGFGERVKVWLHPPPIHLHCLHLQLIACKPVQAYFKHIRYLYQQLCTGQFQTTLHFADKSSGKPKESTKLILRHPLSFPQSLEFLTKSFHIRNMWGIDNTILALFLVLSS